MNKDRNPIELLKELAEKENDGKSYTEISMKDIYLDLFLEISSEIKESVFLKGNILLNHLMPNVARATEDLDMSVTSRDVYYNHVVPKLDKFGQMLVEQGLASKYDVREIQERRSGGIDVYDIDGIKVYAVDVSLSDISAFGVFEYDFHGKHAFGSSMNKILCDKCLSTLSRKRFRRIKDFYDLYIILKSDTVYDVDKIIDLMLEKVSKEELNDLFNNIPFSDTVVEQANHAWTKLRLSSMCTGMQISKPDFSNILRIIYKLYYELIECNERRARNENG